MIGWSIARPHRPHGVTMVSVFLAMMFVVRVDGLVRAAILSPWPQPVYMYNLSHALVDGFVISPLLMLFGGYLAARRRLHEISQAAAPFAGHRRAAW
jgi:hypothetical protein